jgi:hypothetical protein
MTRLRKEKLAPPSFGLEVFGLIKSFEFIRSHTKMFVALEKLRRVENSINFEMM